MALESRIQGLLVLEHSLAEIHISIMFNKQLQSDGFIFTQNLSFPRSHEEMHTELSWGACAFWVRAPQAGSWGSQGCSSAHRTGWGSPSLACTPMAPLHLQRGALGRRPPSPTSPRSLDPSHRGSLEPQPSSSSAFPSGRPCSPKDLSLVSSPLRDRISQHASNHLPSGLQVREALQNQALATRG